MSSRSGMGYSAVVVFLVAFGAAVEVYDEASPELDMDIAYQEENDIDTGPTIEKLQERQLPSMNDILLYRLIKDLQAKDARSVGLLYRPNSRIFENAANQAERDVYSQMNIKDSMHKRLPGAVANLLGMKKAPESRRPQQKWKIKKGKAIGSQMVCYFKLCAFRSPA